MGFFDKILGKKRSDAPSRPLEHAVIAQFAYGSTDLSRLFALEERLESSIADAGGRRVRRR